MDVVICVTGSRPPLKEITHILRSLWTAGIRTGVVEAAGSNEAQDMAKDLGAIHVILFGGDGSLRVRSWNGNGFREKQVNRQELTEYIQKMLRPDQITNSANEINQPIASVSMKTNLFSGPSIPEVEVTFSMQVSELDTSLGPEPNDGHRLIIIQHKIQCRINQLIT